MTNIDLIHEIKKIIDKTSDGQTLVEIYYNEVLRANGNGISKEPSETFLEQLSETIIYLSRNKTVKLFIIENEPIGDTLSEKVYRLVTGKTDNICQYGNMLKYGPPRRERGQSAGYRIFCNSGCQCARESRAMNLSLTQRAYDDDRKKQIKDKKNKTTLLNHGVEEYLSLSKPHEKFIEKYPKGSSQRLDLYKKVKDTTTGRYGGTGYGSQEIRKKIITTNLEKYGNEIVSRNIDVRKKISMRVKESVAEAVEKRRQFYKDNFGVLNCSALEHVKEKTKNTYIEKYGTSSYFKTDQYRGKMKELAKAIGRDHVTQKNIPENVWQCINDEIFMKSAMNIHSMESLSKELCVSRNLIKRFCDKFGIKALVSRFEGQIAEFLNELNVSFETNIRRYIGKELDFYLPDYNIAIEFNGLYWHSSVFKTNDYHKNKMIACWDKDIRLIMINEDEWIERKEAVKSYIRNILHLSEKGIGARKLSIRPISSKEANDFFDSFHIQGKTGTIKYAIGSFYDDILVGAMAFNHQRSTHAIELIRFCSDGKTYAGMFSRMFRHACQEQKYDKVISFADLRYSLGDVYHRNGFVLTDEIKSDYRYVINNRTYHKSSFTKKKIVERFGLDMSILTEKEATDQLGIYRIYDCGKLKFVWEK